MFTDADTSWIVSRAKEEGFDLCGVVRAEKFPELARTAEWLDRGFAGEMKYLSDPRRSNPQNVFEGIRSVIVCALNYNTAKPYSTFAAAQEDTCEPRGWISRYAWGSDYHEVLQEKLEALADAMRERFPEPVQARVYVDTGPVQERILAKHAGLGWTGKNTLLLNQEFGSFFFLGVIMTTLPLIPTLGEAESPPPDLCGTCRRCIDACPTEALVEPYVMDARRCISYLTIELRGSIPEELREPMGWHVFGCDICQDVCPWNRRAPVTEEAEFQGEPHQEGEVARTGAQCLHRAGKFLGRQGDGRTCANRSSFATTVGFAAAGDCRICPMGPLAHRKKVRLGRKSHSLAPDLLTGCGRR